MKQNNFIISLPVYNSYKNLNKIFKNFCKTNLNIKKIIIVDNCSSNSFFQKKQIIHKLRLLYKINIKLIINKINYGIGGSQKILFENLVSEKYDYLINATTSGRYNVAKLSNNILQLKNTNSDYILFSRFIRNSCLSNYSKTRIIGNFFFIFLTKILTKCNFSDPGSVTYLISRKFFDKIYNKTIISLTNSSQFPHFFNIIASHKIIKFKEAPIDWSSGNVKSHLKWFSYCIVLLLSLIHFFFFNKFFKEKKIIYKYKVINF